MAYHRKFCLAITTPDLDRISSSTEGPEVIEKFYYKHNDHGATFYFNSTKPQASLPTCRERPSIAYYLTRNSTKLSYLVKLIHDICTVHGRKVIVFCDWPSTSWLVEVLMLVLGFNVISIRAKYKLKEREGAVAAFNDPDNPVQVLVTSLKVSSVAINLQRDCSDVIFVDVSSNTQSTQRCGGSVVRIGERRPCNLSPSTEVLCFCKTCGTSFVGKPCYWVYLH